MSSFHSVWRTLWEWPRKANQSSIVDKPILCIEDKCEKIWGLSIYKRLWTDRQREKEIEKKEREKKKKGRERKKRERERV